jgi:hypothetical protein
LRQIETPTDAAAGAQRRQAGGKQEFDYRQIRQDRAVMLNGFCRISRDILNPAKVCNDGTAARSGPGSSHFQSRAGFLSPIFLR